jgi:hypothetical protein
MRQTRYAKSPSGTQRAARSTDALRMTNPQVRALMLDMLRK